MVSVVGRDRLAVGGLPLAHERLIVRRCTPFRSSETALVPDIVCPRCGLRTYASPGHSTLERCPACAAPLAAPAAADDEHRDRLEECVRAWLHQRRVWPARRRDA